MKPCIMILSASLFRRCEQFKELISHVGILRANKLLIDDFDIVIVITADPMHGVFADKSYCTAKIP